MDLSGAGLRRAAVWPQLSAAGYLPHALHGAAALWQEKNCYVDLWIELLCALRLDPHALWPCTVALDFEGDQWTFFKPPHGELRALYGIDVQELTIWRPLSEHAIEHLSAGRMLAASQRDQRLKFEILVPVISAERPTAICSFNWHQEHFSGKFGIRRHDGATAHTACLGFGLERVALALIKTHGFEPADWPAEVRARLWT